MFGLHYLLQGLTTRIITALWLTVERATEAELLRRLAPYGRGPVRGPFAFGSFVEFCGSPGFGVCVLCLLCLKSFCRVPRDSNIP